MAEVKNSKRRLELVIMALDEVLSRLGDEYTEEEKRSLCDGSLEQTYCQLSHLASSPS